MKGSITKRGKAYVLRIDVGQHPDGRRRQHTQSFRTKRDADAALANVLRQAQSGSYIKPSRLTVAEFLRDWVEGREAHLRVASFARYRTMAERHLAPSIGTVPLSHLKPTDVQKAHRDALTAGLAPASVHLMHRVLSQALKDAEIWGMVDRNVARLVPPPKLAQAEARFLDAREALRLVEAARSTPYYTALALSLATGLRRGELLGLQWGDIDFEQRTLRIVRSLAHIPKEGVRVQEVKTNSSRRTVALSPNAVLLLRAHQEQAEATQAVDGGQLRAGDFVFSHRTGRPISPSSLTHAFKRIAKDAGIAGARLHTLRHSHASILLNAGANIKDVSDRLGHSNVSITLNKYGHVTPERQAETAARFDQALDLPAENGVQSVSREGTT